MDPSFTWPNAQLIFEEHMKQFAGKPDNARQQDGFFKLKVRALIMCSSNDMKTNIILLSQIVISGHRGITATLSIIEEQ